MNKVMCLCAAAALALASCSNDETVELAKGDAINFRTTVGLNTRGVEVTQASFEAKNELYVTTFRTDGPSTLLYKETKYTKGADNTWTGNQYWGTEDQLHFYLTYPKLSEWSAGEELTRNNQTITLTVKDEIKDQIDYITNNMEFAKTTTSLPITLLHVLSQIQINAKSDNANYKYKVRGIRIHNAYSSLELNLGGLTGNNPSNAKNYEVTYTDAIELDGTSQSIMGNEAGNAMLIPQNVAKWGGSTTNTAATTDPVTGSYLSVLVSITTNAGVGVYPKNTTEAAPTYGWVSVPVDFAWERGKKYIYKLDFTKGAGVVDPVDPNEEGKTDVKPGTDDPGKADPVLGDMIKFNLTVQEWNQTDINQDM